MAPALTALALAGNPSAGEPNPMSSLLLMAAVFAIFYFVLIMPMKSKQKKLDQLVKSLKPGDNVIVNPGIFGQIVSISDEDSALWVRVDEKTKIKVLKSAVAGLQGSPSATEKK